MKISALKYINLKTENFATGVLFAFRQNIATPGHTKGGKL